MSFKGVLARAGWSTDALDLPAGRWITARVALVPTQSIHVMLIRRPTAGVQCNANWTEDGVLRVDLVPLVDIAAWQSLDDRDNVTSHVPRDQRRHLSEASDDPEPEAVEPEEDDDRPDAEVIPFRRPGAEPEPPAPVVLSEAKDPQTAIDDAAYARRVATRPLFGLPGVPDTGRGLPVDFLDGGFGPRPNGVHLP